MALYDVSVFKAVGFKLYCESNGNYETIQCVGSSCACVNEHGDPLGPSVPIYQKHLLRCEGVFQRVYHGNNSFFLKKKKLFYIIKPKYINI